MCAPESLTARAVRQIAWLGVFWERLVADSIPHSERPSRQRHEPPFLLPVETFESDEREPSLGP